MGQCPSGLPSDHALVSRYRRRAPGPCPPEAQGAGFGARGNPLCSPSGLRRIRRLDLGAEEHALARLLPFGRADLPAIRRGLRGNEARPSLCPGNVPVHPGAPHQVGDGNPSRRPPRGPLVEAGHALMAARRASARALACPFPRERDGHVVGGARDRRRPGARVRPFARGAPAPRGPYRLVLSREAPPPDPPGPHLPALGRGKRCRGLDRLFARGNSSDGRPLVPPKAHPGPACRMALLRGDPIPGARLL